MSTEQCPHAGLDPVGLKTKAAIDQWRRLAEIARKEPSIPVWRPRTRYAHALWNRVDARWRALLAEARSVPPEKAGAAQCD